MTEIIPSTTARVPQSTAEDVNRHIYNDTRARVNAYASEEPKMIERRLRELDHEWDIERTLEANAAVISLIGLGLGTFLHRRWYILPTLVGDISASARRSRMVSARPAVSPVWRPHGDRDRL
jgi:hypothetical protein